MPVQFQPYKSMFATQHSAEIAETLRKRFVENYAMQDEVTQHLAQLSTAPFEGDKAEKAKLQTDITGKMDEFAQRGDYENLTMAVSKMASDYQSRATPLMQNQKLYEADREEKVKLLAANKITQSDYEGWELESKKQYDPTAGDYVDYTGVRFDENNRPIAGSYYTPKTVAQFVDVQGEILDQLNSLQEVKEGGYTIQGYQTIDGIEYAMTKEGEIREYVPQELVRQVTQNVLERPDVKSYMSQQSRYGALKADEPTLDAQLTNYARTLRGSESPEAKIRAAEVENLVSNGTTGAKRKALQDAMYSSDYNRYYNMGMNARRPSVYGGGKSMEYSQAYIAGVKANKSEIASDDIILTQGQTQQIVSPLASNAVTPVTEASLKAKTDAANANVTLAAETLLKSSPSLQAMGMTEDALSTVLVNLDEARARKWAAQYDLDPTIVENARKTVHNQQNVINTAREVARYAERTAEATPSQIINTVLEQGKVNASQLASTLRSSEDRMRFAIDLAAQLREVNTGVTERLAVPIQETGFGNIREYDNLRRAGILTTPSPVTNTKLMNESQLDILQTSLERVFNLSSAEAEKMAVQAMSSNNPGSSWMSRTFGDASDYSSAVSAIADEAFAAQGRKANALKEATSGSIRLPELYAVEGEAKKVQEQLNGIFKGKQGTDFSAMSTNAGQSVQTLLGGPENAGNYAVSDLTLVKSMRSDGGIEYMYGVQFKPGSDSGANPVPRMVIPMNQMVAYLPPQAAQTLTQVTNTPADFILDQALAQVVYAPGMTQARGAKVQHKAPGYNLEFVFTPIIGEGGNHQGFQTIQMTGTTPKGAVNHTFASEQEFYTHYNDFQLETSR